MNVRSTRPGLKTSFETDRATDATSGKIESARIRRTAGQTKSQRAAPSDRHAPSVSVARDRARVRRRVGGAEPVRLGSSAAGAVLLLDAKTGHVRGELLVLSDGVGDLVPAVG